MRRSTERSNFIPSLSHPYSNQICCPVLVMSQELTNPPRDNLYVANMSAVCSRRATELMPTFWKIQYLKVRICFQEAVQRAILGVLSPRPRSILIIRQKDLEPRVEYLEHNIQAARYRLQTTTSFSWVL